MLNKLIKKTVPIPLISLPLLFSCATTAATAGGLNERIDSAIEQARSGEYTEAVRSLLELRDRHPENRRILYDLAVIYAWSRQPQKALDTVASLDLDTAPVYALDILAKAARELRNTDLALGYYRTLLKRDPNHRQALLGLAYTHAEAGDLDAAKRQIESALRLYPDDTGVLTGKAHVARLQGETFYALSLYLEILEHDPENREAIQGAYWSAIRLGAFGAAERLMRQAPELFTRQESERQAQRLAAIHLRWGARPEIEARERYREIDQALRILEEIKGDSDWQALDFSDPWQRSLAHDALVGLHARKQIKACIALYRALSRQDGEIPAYALNAAASALLEDEKPEEARALFNQLHERDQRHYPYTEGLFFSLSDAEAFEPASRLIHEVAGDEPRLVGTFDGRANRVNETRLSADIASAYIHAYADDLETAEKRFKELSDAAPHNHYIRSDLATIYRWRGWPRRSGEELAIAIDYQDESQSVDARIQQAHGSIDRTQVDSARRQVTRLSDTYPEHKAVRKLRQRWDTFNDRELLMEYTQGRSSGTQFGSRDATLDTYLFDRRLENGDRFYLHNFNSRARLEAGNAHYQLQTLGYQWVDDGITLNLELGKGLSGSDRAVFNTGLDWWLDDHWNIGGELQFTSRSTPLRAVDSGIDSDSLDIRVNYRWSELQSAGIGISLSGFEDGNNRKSLFAFYRQRLFNSATYKLTGEGGISQSTNSQTGTPYFNPDNDRSRYLQLENEWRVYRRYDHSLHHRLYLTLGDYQQKGFASGKTWNWRYEHDWEVGLPFRLVYGISRGRAVYDGEAEFENSLYLTLNWNF